MNTLNLRDKCTVNTNIDGDAFVGVQCQAGDIKITFPLGFNLSKDEKDARKDILLLLDVLRKNTDQRQSRIVEGLDKNAVDFPLRSYLFIINDYYMRGYYKESEPIYKQGRQGKVDWGKTIKSQTPYIQGGEAYYIDVVVRKNSIKDNEMITLIHEFCVYESFNKIGWLFTEMLPEKPKIKFNKRLFVKTITEKINKTFNDQNKQLFNNMLNIVKSIGNDGNSYEYKIGTNRFEYIWEAMIDKAFGEKNKEYYFPKTRWLINSKEHENSYLEPDTIMISKDKPNSIYVVDAKYYKYGWSHAPGHLPDSSSINKQITYGEYIAEKPSFYDEKGNPPEVYNAFLLPYDSSDEYFESENNMTYIGIAISDWKKSDGLKPYEKIVGILLDVKSLMQNYSKDYAWIKELADLIELSVVSE